MHLTLLFTVFMCFSYISSIPIEILNYNDPYICNSSEIFNVNLLKCQICDLNKNLVPSSDKQNCVCNERSKPIYDSSTKLSTPNCEKCKSDLIFSQYINNCIKCTAGFVKINNITSCKPCKDNEIMVQQFTNGTFLSQTRCIPCTNGMMPSDDGSKCVPCPILNPVISNGTLKCICDYKSVMIGNICVPKVVFPQFSNTKNKYYLQYHTGEKFESDLFDSKLKLNIYLCQLKNETACQILANLCTLTLFSTYDMSPCNLWLESRNNLDIADLNYLPWLIYREGEANIVLNRKKIPVQYSLQPTLSISRLNLTAVIFNLDGTLKEVRNILGSDLNLCPNLNYIKDVGLRFGINYEYNCKIEAKQLFQAQKMEFIVPYLQYYENDKNMLYAIPVLIRNLVQYRNNLDDPSSWLLVRRFFMLDSTSSISSKSYEPSIYRYVKSVQIKIKLRDDENGLIYPPLIILEYGEFTKDKYHSEKIDFKFSTQYEMKNSIRNPIEITIGTLSALVIIYSGIQTWSYSKRSGKIGIDSLTLVRIILFSCGNLANAFFIVAFSTSVYIFIFFKGQSVVHLLLPTTGQEKILKDFVITAFVLKIVEIVILIWNQINIDIFLIDWERPRPMDTIPRPRRSVSPFTLSSNSQTVSIWRTYFIANEWNEIQTTRKINILAHFLLITFILKVVGIEYWGTSDPELHTTIPENLQNNQMSFVCRFAVGSLVYVSVYLIQLLFMMGIYERYVKNTIQQFVDLCSLANISVFIMSLQRYGFYIHGRSSHGFSDTDMATMLKQLKREEEDLCAYRGLLPGTHNQTFSVGIPAKLRLYYNKLMNPARSNSTFGTSISNLGLGDNSPSRSFESNRSEFDRISQAYNNLNKFLSAFLEHALKDLDYDVKDKLFVESLLDIEFTDSVERGVLYPDNGHSFDSVLFYGNEFCLFSFDLMLFSFVLLLFDDFVVTILSTICVIEVLKMVRNYGGKRNLAHKTLIDHRFLI